MAIERETLRPRGTDVMLPHGGLPEVIPPYLQKLILETGGANGPLGLQFVAQPELEAFYSKAGLQDSLIEDENEIAEAPGLVYKYQDHSIGGITYPGRALWTITRTCAAYCRFCTRGREVGIPSYMEGQGSGALAHTPHLSDEQIEQTLKYIREKPGLNEIILSGGDPLTVRPDKLYYVLGELRKLQDTGKLDIVRIGTRVPIHNPPSIKDKHYEAIAQLRNPFMMIHINHAAELTPEAIIVIIARVSEVYELISGTEEAARTTWGKMSAERVKLIASSSFRIIYGHIFYGVPPKAVVARPETMLVRTKAPRTIAKPIAEYQIVFFERSNDSGLPELVI
jgi:hypothetical protein